MKKKMGMIVGILVMGIFLLVGCGEKEKTTEELLSSVGLKTLPEVVGMEPAVKEDSKLHEEQMATYGMTCDTDDEVRELATQYMEYLTKECGEPDISDNHWEKGNLHIYLHMVTSEGKTSLIQVGVVVQNP